MVEEEGRCSELLSECENSEDEGFMIGMSDEQKVGI